MTFKPFPEISYECVDEETGEIVIRTNREEELIRVRTYRSEDEIARLVDCWNACRKIAFPDAHLKAIEKAGAKNQPETATKRGVGPLPGETAPNGTHRAVTGGESAATQSSDGVMEVAIAAADHFWRVHPRDLDRMGYLSRSDFYAAEIAKLIRSDRERMIRMISDQAAAMAEMSLHGLPEQSRVREAMEAALTQVASIIRAAAAAR